MIGVIADPWEHPAVREFFELFKTPWEFYHGDRQYEVVLCAVDAPIKASAKLILVYGGRPLSFDAQSESSASRQQDSARILCYKELRIPIYGSSVTFPGTNSDLLADGTSREAVAYLHKWGRKPMVRIGYDLFREVSTLLTAGQPIANADIPSLDLHICLLRDLIIASGVTLLEIPPVPAGYRFIACLTHDVDHPSIRKHRLDHTIFGFLYRATLGSLLKAVMGQVPIRQMWANWAAALKLPFVYLGLAEDFWERFDCYPALERAARSSFFFIPVKGYPGRTRAGLAPNRRASGYSAAEIAGQIQTLKSTGCEIGLHGIDAWLDSSKGSEELEEIRRITGTREIGVRMHWLYFNEKSPATLERAGADYDSSVGYNETVGYRAGTTQAYKPLEVSRLLELPLHVMDTALFYPAHLGLSPAEARKRVGIIVDNVVRLGGCVTVNWHDRSIAPERGWGDFYLELVEELRDRGAWFATAAEAVAWFRKRRLATFEEIPCESDASQSGMADDSGQSLPALRFRFHNATNMRDESPVDATCEGSPCAT
jgi:hypothetical protein